MVHVRSLLTVCAISVAIPVAGCATTTASRVGSAHAPRDPDTLDLSLHTTDGRILELADQRGGPVLLFLFATYDGASIAIHRALTRFTRARMDTVVIAIALQLDAEVFATAYAETQAPPYTVTFDPRGAIVRGASDLGPLEAIPTVIMIDAHGVECARHVGYTSERELDAMYQIALSRGGIVARAEPVSAPEALPPDAPRPDAPPDALPPDAPPARETDAELDPRAFDPGALVIEPDDSE